METSLQTLEAQVGILAQRLGVYCSSYSCLVGRRNPRVSCFVASHAPLVAQSFIVYRESNWTGRQRSVNAFKNLSGIARKKSQCCHARPSTALRLVCDQREDDMSINIGDTIRLAETQEEGVVVATSNNTPNCVLVHFGKSFAYLIERKELELVATRTRV